MERSRFSSTWIAVAVSLVAASSLVTSQGIVTIPQKAYVKSLSNNVSLLCLSDKAISDCSVRIPGYPFTYDIDNLPEGITPYGNGQCGIRIGTVKQANEGKFQCNVTVGGEIFQEAIEVVIAVTPEPTDIELDPDTIIEDGGFAENQTLRLRCTSENGVPVANLTWQLDGQPVDEKYLGEPEFSQTVDKKGKKLMTVSQQFVYPLTANDNGKNIVCRAEHFAIGKGFYRAFLPLDVRFPPRPIPTIYIGDGVHTLVNVTIKANPRPKISWKVNGETIEEGQSVGPFQAYYPRDMGFGDYLVLLKINERTDRTAIFELAATNELGTQTYVIKASKQEDESTTGSGAVFWLISIWTFFCSVIVSCLLSVPPSSL